MEDGSTTSHVGKEVKGRTHTFYQVLIDSRDCPFIVSMLLMNYKAFSDLFLAEMLSVTFKFFSLICSNYKTCIYLHFLLQRAQTEAVTFLGTQESSRSLYAIPGLDYVAHEDILPYTTTEKNPLQHELFDKFLAYCPERGLLLLVLTVRVITRSYLFLMFILNLLKILHLEPKKLSEHGRKRTIPGLNFLMCTRRPQKMLGLQLYHFTWVFGNRKQPQCIG